MVERTTKMNKTLKIARVEKGITQKELASQVGVTSKYISLIERNDLRPSPDIMRKISKCVDVSVQDLFFSEV